MTAVPLPTIYAQKAVRPYPNFLTFPKPLPTCGVCFPAISSGKTVAPHTKPPANQLPQTTAPHPKRRLDTRVSPRSRFNGLWHTNHHWHWGQQNCQLLQTAPNFGSVLSGSLGVINNLRFLHFRSPLLLKYQLEWYHL